MIKSNNQENFTPLSKIHLSELKKLQQKKFRSLEKQVLVEGWNLIEQLIANGIKPIKVISTQPDEVLHKLSGLDCPVISAKEQELRSLAETETPQAIIAVYKIPLFTISSYRAMLYLDGIQDPGNLGAIFRIAAAFNLDGIALSQDCCDVFSPKVIRASLGSVFWRPSITADENWLKKQAVNKIGLMANSDLKLADLQLEQEKPILIVIGSEGNGIRNNVRAELTSEVSIPIAKQMESLNAAVAAGIAIYEISQRLFLLT
jgi:TrmH family RNA methyltransferase